MDLFSLSSNVLINKGGLAGKTMCYEKYRQIGRLSGRKKEKVRKGFYGLSQERKRALRPSPATLGRERERGNKKHIGESGVKTERPNLRSPFHDSVNIRYTSPMAKTQIWNCPMHNGKRSGNPTGRVHRHVMGEEINTGGC